MRHVLGFTTLAFGLAVGFGAVAQPAQAAAPDAMHSPGSLGFHHVEAPIGLRWWLSGQKVGIDLGLGFNSTPAEIDPDESETGFALDIGVPFVLHSWENVHFMFRPGLLYQSQEEGFDEEPGTPGIQFDTESTSEMSLLAELEVEAFLRDNFSVSASHGIGFVRSDPGFGGDETTSFGTFGREFTNIGFHVYFLGGSH